MNKQYVICATCKKPISGNGVQALGKSFHKEHFLCGYCKKTLSSTLFYEHEGAAYCESDYDYLFTPRCALCNEIIIMHGVKALGKNFHKEHFQCGYCHKVLDHQVFYEKDGAAYCESDYVNYISPICAQCNGEITSDGVRALGRNFHKQHFQCAMCLQELANKVYFEHEGLIYCEADYNNIVLPKCGHCNGPIVDGVAALGQQFHKEHFLCGHCKQQIGTQNFIVREGIPYCEKDFHNLFMPKCANCGGVILKNCLEALGRTWHAQHCVCTHCRKPYDKDIFVEKDGKPYCKDDFNKLFPVKCLGCNNQLTDKDSPIKTPNGSWHPNCFAANY